MKKVKLHKPSVEELWFRAECMSDPNTMAYNAGYDVSYAGYHYDTGCIDFDKDSWQSWYDNKMNNPNFFYAYIVDCDNNNFVGYVNFNNNPQTNHATMGIVIKYEHQGQGYMTPALQQMFVQAKQQGVRVLTDTVPDNRQRALSSFYKNGFVKTGEYTGKKFGKDEIVCEIEKTL